MNEPIAGDGASQPAETTQQPGIFTQLTPELTRMGMPQIPLSQTLSGVDTRVVFIQDTHGITPLGNILNFQDAALLKSQGYTHYLVEGSANLQPLLDQLGQGKTVQLVGVLGLSPTGMENQQDAHAIYSMAERGLRVLAIDHPANNDSKRPVSTEEREQFFYARIRDVINNGGRAIITIGGAYAIPGLLSKGVPTVAQRIMNDGIDVVFVAYQKPNPTNPV